MKIKNMDYEQKYKEALEGIRELYNSDCDMIRVKRLKRRLKIIFPELKESEDERIRREIIDFLRLPHPQFVGKRDHEKWIDWLEKQADKDKLIRELGEYKVKYTQKVLQEDLNKNTESQSQPKFKLRDWIVDDVGNYWRVVKVQPNYYEIVGDDGVKSIPTRKYVDEKYHLWTIDDAKKGDILVVDDTWIVEFDKKMTDGCTWKDTSILTSFEYNMDDDICTTGSHMFYMEIRLASKENIDLFKKKRNQYLASNSHNESKFKVGDKVTMKGDNTVYTIGIIAPDKTCWLKHGSREYGWATFGVLKHYVE